MDEKETKKYDCKYGSDEKSLKDSIRAWVSVFVDNEEMVAEMDEDVAMGMCAKTKYQDTFYNAWRQ